MSNLAFTIPEPNYIKRLPRAPPIAKNPKFVPGERVEHTLTSLTNKQQVCQRAKLLCICDLQPFEGDPFGIPLHYSEQLEQYFTKDAACSVRCAIAHVQSDRSLNAQTILPLITQFAFDVFSIDEPFFEPAPPRSLLATGQVTLEEYRGFNYQPLVNKKPWMVVQLPTTVVWQALTMEPQKPQQLDRPEQPAGNSPLLPLLCICDMQPFSTKPFHIPLAYDDRLNKFQLTKEAACGPRCAARYVQSDRKFCAHIVLPLINQRARAEFGFTDGPIAPSPSRSVLASGLMSLEEYRSGLDFNGRPCVVSCTLSTFALNGATTARSRHREQCEHVNASVAALAAAGAFYSGSGELPQPSDICDAIITTIKDNERVHCDTSVNDHGLEPVAGFVLPRRSMGMTVLRAPRAPKLKEQDVMGAPHQREKKQLGVANKNKRGLDVFLQRMG